MNIWLGILLAVILALLAGICLMNLYMSGMKKKKLLYEMDESIAINPLLDLVYKQTAQRDLGMNVYLPGNPGPSKFPAVVLIHGDGPEAYIKDAKDWALFSSYGRLLASLGLAGITFNHRGVGSNCLKIDDAAADVLDAVDFVKKNAAAWNVDEDRICIWAFSAGGPFLSLFLKDKSQPVKCLVSFYGLLDLRLWVKTPNEGLKSYQPENYLAAVEESPAILIVKAAKDIPKINDSVTNFMQAAEARNIKYELMIHSSGRHGFDALDDNQETRSVIQKTLEFVKKNT